MSIYSADVARQYYSKALGIVPPHAFAIADTAYRGPIVMKAYSISNSSYVMCVGVGVGVGVCVGV